MLSGVTDTTAAPPGMPPATLPGADGLPPAPGDLAAARHALRAPPGQARRPPPPPAPPPAPPPGADGLPPGPGELAAALQAIGYLPDEGLATAAYLALVMRRPLFLEGEPGVGKTALARALAGGPGGPAARLERRHA